MFHVEHCDASRVTMNARSPCCGALRTSWFSFGSLQPGSEYRVRHRPRRSFISPHRCVSSRAHDVEREQDRAEPRALRFPEWKGTWSVTIRCSRERQQMCSAWKVVSFEAASSPPDPRIYGKHAAVDRLENVTHGVSRGCAG